MSRCVLLDRDGVINRRIPNGYVTSWEQFEFLPRALDALRLLAEGGHRALVVSNQACVPILMRIVISFEFRPHADNRRMNDHTSRS